jgi:exo-beta-1,3-glucanase (GH17 family)
MRVALRLLVLALAIGCNFFYWQQIGKPIELPDIPNARYDCLSYTAYTDGHDPTNPNTSVSDSIIDADLKALTDITDCIRLYSTRGSTPASIAAANKYGVKVILGAWIGGSSIDNKAEIDNAIALTKRYPDTIKMVVVGNEVLLRQELPYDRLGELIKQVKQNVSVPVAYADVYDFWIQYPQMADYVDVILVHLLPYWGDPAPNSEQAQAVLEGSLKDFLGRFKGKNIMIGETGWPSAGPSRQQAAASIVDQARFVRNFIQSANQLHVSYNLIEALDQPWKRIHEGTAGGYWGIKNVDRENKFPLTGPVSEWPQWPLYSAIAAILGLLISASSLLNRQTSLPTSIVIILSAQVIGTLAIFAWRLAQETSQTSFGFFFNHIAIVLLLGSSALAFWLLQLAPSLFTPAIPCRDFFNMLLTSQAWKNENRLPTLQTLCLFLGAFAAAVISLSLAVEMRHQDIPWPMFTGSVLLAMVTLLINRKNNVQVTGRIEAWLAIILLVSAPLCFDGWDNEPAILWQITAVILALPWLGAIKNEIRLVVS